MRNPVEVKVRSIETNAKSSFSEEGMTVPKPIFASEYTFAEDLK